nr:MAG TPA: hypothetical protein [Caudoviricetes sp.]
MTIWSTILPQPIKLFLLILWHKIRRPLSSLLITLIWCRSPMSSDFYTVTSSIWFYNHNLFILFTSNAALCLCHNNILLFHK